MPYSFTPPSFLSEDQDAIYQRMLEILPPDIESAKGGFAWDYFYPVAVEIARNGQFTIPNALQLAWPQFAVGNWLDLHGENRGIVRRSPTASVGELQITGKPGATVPAGTLFSTAGTDGAVSVDFATTEAVVIGEDGTVMVEAQCTSTGKDGNVSAGTITLKGSTISAVTSVTNPEAFTGGIEAEDDESLRARILDYDRNQGESYVGSMADYRRWALSVDGIGSATVIPAQDDTGLVTIVLTDQNGAPANDTLCEAVYNYIMRPDDPYSRLAPINAYLRCIPPKEIAVTIAAVVELDGASLETVKIAFQQSLLPYFGEVPGEGEIRYTKVASILSETAGVHDFKDLTINGGTANIPIDDMAAPALEAINLTEGVV